MRCAIFTDVHANLEALEAVLRKIDEITEDEPIDQLWFLGDLVGYGPNPNECIDVLCKRTEIIIAGNHDWAAVGKIDLEDFSPAARISAEWTAKQLTAEHADFLANLPERLEIGECTLVHGSPFGPLWEYLTSPVLAERSFHHFSTRFCFIGHTHVPIIFQQPDTIANEHTHPLSQAAQQELLDPEPLPYSSNGALAPGADDEGEAVQAEAGMSEVEEMVAIPSVSATSMQMQSGIQAESAYANPQTGQAISEEAANILHEPYLQAQTESAPKEVDLAGEPDTLDRQADLGEEAVLPLAASTEADVASAPRALAASPESSASPQLPTPPDSEDSSEEDAGVGGASAPDEAGQATPELQIQSVEERLNSEIEELFALLGLSESMIAVTNEMLAPPEGHWNATHGYRAIVNPGGVGQPRDGDPRAAFMIYDSKAGFEFYRIPYDFHKTQEKILKAGLPRYLALRLAEGH